MAIVARLTFNQGKAASQETFALLRKSKLGEGFAAWVAKNQEALLSNPRVRPEPKVKQCEKPVQETQTPSQAAKQQPKKQAAKEEAPPKALKEEKPPCFYPYNGKTFKNLNAEEQRADLQDYAKQLQRQQDALNSMTATEYKAARDAFDAAKRLNPADPRNPLAKGAQAAYRDRFEEMISNSIKDSLRAGNPKMTPGQVRVEAAKRIEAVMEKQAALHEPDMVAGGWAKPDTTQMGRADVNSSIGGSWNQSGRIGSMDKAANDAIASGQGDRNMNVKLEPCRGKGMR